MRAWFDWLHMASFHESLLDKKWAPWEHSAGQTFDAHHWDKNEQDWAGKDTQSLIDMDLEWRSVRSWPWHLWRSSFQPPPARPKMTKKREANFIKAYSCLCQEVYKRFLRFILLSCTMNTFEYEKPLEPTCFHRQFLRLRPRNRRISATASSISVPCKASCNTRRPRALPSMIFRERLRKTIEKYRNL